MDGQTQGTYGMAITLANKNLKKFERHFCNWNLKSARIPYTREQRFQFAVVYPTLLLSVLNLSYPKTTHCPCLYHFGASPFVIWLATTGSIYLFSHRSNAGWIDQPTH
jgi:hypothetical protein